MKAKDLFSAALDQATTVVDYTKVEDFHRPTPDTEWDVHTLVSHMLYELCWVHDMVLGKTVAEVGTVYDGDLIGHALQANWHAAAATARDTVRQANLKDIVHMSHADTTVDEYIRQVSTDVLIHAWDLGAAIGRPVQMDTLVAQAALEYLRPRAAEWHAKGFLAAAVEADADADAQTQLLALSGRPEWRTL